MNAGRVRARARRVGVELALLVVLVAAPLVGLIAFLLYDSARRDEERASSLVTQMAATTAGRAARYVERMRTALEAIAKRPLVRAMDPERCDPELAALRELYGNPTNLIVVNLEGRIICGATPPPRDRVVRIVDERLRREMLAEPRFRLSRPLVGQITKRWTVVAVQPVFEPGGAVVGAAAMGIELANWVSFSRSEAEPKGTVHAVVTADGIVIARSAGAEEWIGRNVGASEIHRRMLELKRGTVRALGTEGADRVWGFSPVGETGWYALSSVSARRVFGPVRALTIESAVLMAAAIGLAIAAAYLLVARLVRPMRAIASALRERTGGRRDVRVPLVGAREIADLAGELNRMIDAGERAESALQRFRLAMDSTPDSIYLTDPASMRFLDVNAAACTRLGYTRAQLLEMGPHDVLGRDRETVRREYDAVIAAGEQGLTIESRFTRSDGSTGWTEIHRRALLLDGEPLIVTLGRDITERKAQQQRIERLNRVYAVLSGINGAIVRIRDRAELFQEACRIAVDAGRFPLAWIGVLDRAGERIDPVAWAGDERGFVKLVRPAVGAPSGGKAGLSAQAVSSRAPAICNDIAADGSAMRYPAEAIARGYLSAVALPLASGDAAIGALVLYAGEVGFFDDEEIKLLMELAGDISFALDHIEKEEKLNYLALYDALTGLANRTLFLERLGQYLHGAGQAGEKLALVVADVERLRMVNDSLGRQAGDALLRELAERLAGGAARGELARISADHFAVVMQVVRGRSEVARRFETMWNACFRQAFRLGETEVRASARAGIALFPSDGAVAESLLRSAEAALKRAKDIGERYVFHAREMTAQTAEKLSLETRLRQALEQDEFVLHYQPKVDLERRRIVGVEALIRWQSPELGLVPPMQFIPLMEETGMILEAGNWALARAVADHARWLEQGLAPPRVAVNVSAIQLRKRDYVATVERALKRNGATPPGIDLEITESLLMEDIEGNIGKLREVRGLGVGISIDDFGTGYSSLAYLAKLPVEALKIDRSFIVTMLSDADTMTLVQTIISLAHSL
ncbi:MAG: EAL domain-containing protein [Betaproteobacteria bacterium]|nr:EAL domain-containing protein [Betaproteobacteria bacterium]